MLLAAERRLTMGLARPAEVLRFFLLAVEETAALLKVDRAVLCLIDSEDSRLLRVMAGSGFMAEEEGELLPIQGSFEGRVYQTISPARTGDLTAEPELYRPRQNHLRAGPAIAVPLRIRKLPIGVLLAGREVGGAPFLERDAELLLQFATPITAAIESMRHFDSARRSREAVETWNREQLLRQWLWRYETIASARVELVFRLDAGGTLEWGGSTTPLFGVAAPDFAPKLESLSQWVVPADREKAMAALNALINPSGPQSTCVELGLLLQDGSSQPTRLWAWRVRDKNEVVGVLTPAERSPVEEDQAAAAEANVENIVRALRHQINNPLAAVIGRAQLMIREDMVQREPMLRQSVETILFESERINRFVQQLQNVDGLSRLTEPLPGEVGTRGW